MPDVLIVDDNEKNRKLAASLLSAAGFRTIEAATATVAIELAAEHVPDVVLMDLRLPDIDGAEAARRLGDDERTAAIPIVALSALSLEGNDDWLQAAGFAGWLEKPIRVDTFADQVRGYCAEATG
ncbi:MAG TPA: response regulator [Actinomycetota bacterium]|nr:response regulator [Actinomycetota bacterium]